MAAEIVGSDLAMSPLQMSLTVQQMLINQTQNRGNAMTTYRTALLLALASLVACGDVDPTVGSEVETDTFRQALPSAEDVSLDYGADGAARQALNGDYSLIAGLTAHAVVGTNATMVAHFALMEYVSNLPPTEAGEDFRVWQGEHEELTVRVRADRVEVPEGLRYDYTLSGRVTADGGELLPVITGHVVRVGVVDDEAPRNGFGIVRFHFENLDTLEPEREIGGKARVSFRKEGRAHQVHVRFIDVRTPDDPYFPSAAEYVYAVQPDESGAMAWYSRGDVKKDGEPFEDVAVHSVWRADKSGIGSGFVTGGSLEVDYWHLLECWDPTFIKGYGSLATPGLTLPSGDAASCFARPENLEVPEQQEVLPDEDPAIPGPIGASN